MLPETMASVVASGAAYKFSSDITLKADTSSFTISVPLSFTCQPITFAPDDVHSVPFASTLKAPDFVK